MKMQLLRRVHLFDFGSRNEKTGPTRTSLVMHFRTQDEVEKVFKRIQQKAVKGWNTIVPDFVEGDMVRVSEPSKTLTGLDPADFYTVVKVTRNEPAWDRTLHLTRTDDKGTPKVLMVSNRHMVPVAFRFHIDNEVALAPSVRKMVSDIPAHHIKKGFPLKAIDDPKVIVKV